MQSIEHACRTRCFVERRGGPPCVQIWGDRAQIDLVMHRVDGIILQHCPTWRVGAEREHRGPGWGSLEDDGRASREPFHSSLAFFNSSPYVFRGRSSTPSLGTNEAATTRRVAPAVPRAVASSRCRRLRTSSARSPRLHGPRSHFSRSLGWLRQQHVHGIERVDGLHLEWRQRR